MWNEATVWQTPGVCLLAGLGVAGVAAATRDKLRVLVLCAGNSARSQMTEGDKTELAPALAGVKKQN